MHLHSRFSFPPIIFLCILICLGSVQYFQGKLIHQEEEVIEKLEGEFISLNDILLKKMEEHFDKTLTVATQLETNTYVSNLESDINSLKQVEYNVLSFLKTLEKEISALPTHLNSPVTPAEFQKLYISVQNYFTTANKGLLEMETDKDHADLLLLNAAKSSIQIRNHLRLITSNLEYMLHTALFDNKTSLSNLITIFWWITFGLAFASTCWILLINQKSAGKMRNLFNRFEQIFPEVRLDKTVQKTQDVISQLEMLTERLEQSQGNLRTNRKQLDQLVSKSRTAILVHRNLTPLFSNAAFLDLCGFVANQDILNIETILDIFPMRERLRIPQIMDENMAQPNPSKLLKMDIIRQDGTIRRVLNQSFIIEWNGQKALCTTLIDITDLQE